MSLASSASSSSSSTSPPSLSQECSLTFRLALPLIIGQLGQMLMGVVDTVMIGRLGVAPLGAATLANTLLAVPLMLGFGMLSSISVKVSQAHGADDPEGAKSALRHGTWLALAFGLATVLVAMLIIPALTWMRQPPDVVAHTPAYLLICAVSMIPAMLTLAWKSHADALNQPWIPFWIQIGGVGLNVVLNWILIWGKWGVPALGLEGAGYATLLARSLTAIAMFIWLTRASFSRSWVPDRWFARCQASVFKALLAIGIPASLHLLTEVGAFVGCTLMIGSLGAVPLAAHQVAINCAATTFMVPLGVAMAMTVRVGEIIGANQPQRLKRVLISGWIFALSFMAVSMTAFLTVGSWLAAQFVADSGVIEIAARLLIIAGVFQLADGFQVICSFALRGINDVSVPARTAFVAYWIVALPLGAYLTFQHHWGVDGLWWGLTVGLGVAAIILGQRAWRLLVTQQQGSAAYASSTDSASAA